MKHVTSKKWQKSTQQKLVGASIKEKLLCEI